MVICEPAERDRNGRTRRNQARQAEPQRGTIAEWTVTILLLLFGTTTLVQAFVIPTGSMEDTLLIGDHLLVDKLAYAPPGPISKYLLPYETSSAATSSCSAIRSTSGRPSSSASSAFPGDRIRIVNKQVYPERQKLERAVQVPQDRLHRFLPRQFPGRADTRT